MKFVKVISILLISCSFISAQTSADAHYEVLDNQFRQNIKAPSSFLIEEFKEYIIIYPNSKQEDEVLYNLSELYKRNKNVPAQLFSLIKLRILHPNSPLGKKSYQIIDSLIIYNNALLLTNNNEKAVKEINNLTPAINYQLAYVELLSFLHFAEIKIFEKLFIEEIRSYKTLFGQSSENLDAINYWQACAYKRSGDLSSALLNFQKVSEIYRNSKFVPPSLLEIAKIYSKTNKKDKAADCLIELINQYPDVVETGDAQYELAQLYHYHYKDLNEALTNYKMLAQVFPENQYFNSALMNSAKISEGMNKYDDALYSYMMIVENNTVTAETLTALKNILRIHLKILKDYNHAAQDYILITQMFPENKDAAQNLLNAAKLYRENLKDNQKANEILQIILTSYKKTTEAKEAEKILSNN